MGVDRAYFVVGSTVLPYDIELDGATGEQVELGALWAGLPPAFAAGIDAALDVGDLNLYVFRGSEYVRIPFGTQAVAADYPRPIQGNWRGVTFDRIDAAMSWGDGKSYLFRGSEYARYDIAADAQDPGYPKPIAGNWKGVSAAWVGDGIDAAVNPGNGRAYFVKGTDYATIDWHTKSKVDGPQPVADDWPGLAGPFDAAWTNLAGPPPPPPNPVAADFAGRFGAFAEDSETGTGVPALVTLGQAALESDWGRAAPGDNFFGIKARASDPPESRQLLRTREVLSRPDATFPEVISVTPRPDGKFEYVVRDWFRVYPSPRDAFAAHGRFLRDNRRFAAAFQHTDDPYAFARAVADAGYATDPRYASVLTDRMRLIDASR